MYRICAATISTDEFCLTQLLLACGREGLFDDVLRFLSEKVVPMYNIQSKQPQPVSEDTPSGVPPVINDTFSDLAKIVRNMTAKEVTV